MLLKKYSFSPWSIACSAGISSLNLIVESNAKLLFSVIEWTVYLSPLSVSIVVVLSITPAALPDGADIEFIVWFDCAAPTKWASTATVPVLPASDLAILDYTIRCYPKGEGIFKTHVDQSEGGTISRLFACIIYLNDVEEGGETFFPDWNIGCRCERGKILLFPCNWIFPHGSNKNISHDKYILTAFINLNYDMPMYSDTEL